MIYFFIWAGVMLLLWVASGVFGWNVGEDEPEAPVIWSGIVFWPFALVLACVVFPCMGAVWLGRRLRKELKR